MSSYAWVITVDHLYDPEDGLPSRVGTQGPHDATEQQLAKAAEGRKWRVLDDDGIVYYGGSRSARIGTRRAPASTSHAKRAADRSDATVRRGPAYR